MGVHAAISKSFQDLVPLLSSSDALAATGVYTSAFVHVDGYGKVTGQVYAVHALTVGAAVFSGVGLDDMTTSGTYTDLPDRTYIAEIDGNPGIDTFRWSNDGGVTWEATGVAMTAGVAQLLEDGVHVTFAAGVGHTIGEYWTFTTSRENGNLYVEFSDDGITSYSHATVKTVYSDHKAGASFVTEVVAPYVRFRYVCGAIAQTSFHLTGYKKVI